MKPVFKKILFVCFFLYWDRAVTEVTYLYTLYMYFKVVKLLHDIIKMVTN